MKLAATLAACALLLSMPAAAQTTAPSGPITPTPAALAHAQHLMDVMHMDKMMAQMGPAMMKPMMSQMTEKMTAKQRERLTAFQDAMWAEMAGLTPKLTDAMVKIYATNLTEQELADIDQFYSGPTGQAVLTKMPQLTQQLVPVMMNEMPGMMTRTIDRYCAKVTCSKQERASFGKAAEMMGPKKPG